MKIYLKILITIFYSVFIVSTFSAQERIVVHKDKPYYVPGEVMWYKVYLPNYFDSHKITYKVIVSNSKGQKHDSYFVKCDGQNTLEAYYKFPYNLSTDIYQFHFYTLTKLTKKEVLLTSFEVPFYNDLIKIDKEVSTVEVMPDVNELIPIYSHLLSIRTDQETYGQGDTVKLQIATTDANGNILNTNYSVSVIDESLIGSDWSAKTISVSKTEQLDSDVVQYLDDNLYVRGKVYNPDGTPKRINQLGVFDGQSNNMHLARSDDNGEFALFLPAVYGQRNIQFAGYISNEAPDIKVTLSTDRQLEANREIIYNLSVEEYLKASRDRKKIYQYYKSLEYDLNLAKVEDEIRFSKPDKTYDLSKFVTFKNVGSFFDEILSAPLKFNQEGEEITAVMFDPDGFKKFTRNGGSNDNFIFPPVFIIDGKLTQNAKHVYSMDLNAVTTIELYNTITTIAGIFGNFRNYGVVKINTTLPDVTIPTADQEDIHSFEGLQPTTNFLKMNSLNKEIPQLRPLVYWNSDINSSSIQKANIMFNASDDISKFKIIVVGQTEDGQIVQGAAIYSTILGESHN